MGEHPSIADHTHNYTLPTQSDLGVLALTFLLKADMLCVSNWSKTLFTPRSLRGKWLLRVSTVEGVGRCGLETSPASSFSVSISYHSTHPRDAASPEHTSPSGRDDSGLCPKHSVYTQCAHVSSMKAVHPAQPVLPSRRTCQREPPCFTHTLYSLHSTMVVIMANF